MVLKNGQLVGVELTFVPNEGYWGETVEYRCGGKWFVGFFPEYFAFVCPD